MGFTDDIIVRVTPASSGSRIDLRSSSRYGRSDFGLMPPAFAITSRRCAPPQPAKVSASLAVLLADAGDCRW